MAEKGITLPWQDGARRLDDLLHTIRQKGGPPPPRQVGWHMAQCTLEESFLFQGSFSYSLTSCYLYINMEMSLMCCHGVPPDLGPESP